MLLGCHIKCWYLVLYGVVYPGNHDSNFFEKFRDNPNKLCVHPNDGRMYCTALVLILMPSTQHWADNQCCRGIHNPSFSHRLTPAPLEVPCATISLSVLLSVLPCCYRFHRSVIGFTLLLSVLSWHYRSYRTIIGFTVLLYVSL